MTVESLTSAEIAANIGNVASGPGTTLSTDSCILYSKR